MNAIVFKNVSKLYRKGPKIIPTMREWMDFVAGRSLLRESKNTFYALKDLSFTIGQGEVVGFVGKNGAGKSTLLKLISRVTYPTDGQVYTRGKIAGLLELGAGFHPELTGRENIFFKSAILGMSKTEIKAREASIVKFSELEDFIDTPIKYYSSGMYARLGFSVAIHLEPEILLIDEVLSVGDAAFRDKCITRVQEFCKDKNRTVVFVSHNFTCLKKLCRKVFWLDRGKIVDSGNPKAITEAYLKSVRVTK